ncbi:MAG: hypothetical protein ACOCR1_01175 [Planctomycetota bacterium]
MKKEYDFSEAERGKFFREDAEMDLPVYLEDDVRDFVEEIAEKKQEDLSNVVNELIRSDMQLAKVMK